MLPAASWLANVPAVRDVEPGVLGEGVVAGRDDERGDGAHDHALDLGHDLAPPEAFEVGGDLRGAPDDVRLDQLGVRRVIHRHQTLDVGGRGSAENDGGTGGSDHAFTASSPSVHAARLRRQEFTGPRPDEPGTTGCCSRLRCSTLYVWPAMKKTSLCKAAVCLALPALVACSRTPSEPSGASSGGPSPATSTASAASITPAVSTGAPKPALAFDDPPRWQRRPPSSAMRAAEYRVPRAAGDPEDAECTVITFGPGMGGSVDDNIDRWVKQLDGASPPVRSTRTVHGMKVTRVETTGTYLGMRMPGAPPSHPALRISPRGSDCRGAGRRLVLQADRARRHG